MTRSSRRDVLGALHRKGPLTAKGVAKAVGLDPRNAANICSLMACSGLLREEFADGSRKRRRYTPAVEVLPSDAALLNELVEAYGPHRVSLVLRDIILRLAVEGKAEVSRE